MIRLASEADLEALLAIFQTARSYMEKNGNPTQWAGGYPARELLESDIRQHQLYVCEAADGHVHGVFAFILGQDPAYARIEDGAWKNDAPYGTIHRIASDGAVKGIFSACMEFCKGRIPNLRIDTHQNNLTMQHLVEKNGFERCGIIHLADGSPRIAYQYTRR